jgi:hypothetical protein
VERGGRAAPVGGAARIGIECGTARRTKSKPAEQLLLAIRERNAQIARITRHLRKVHSTAERLSLELTLELARLCNAFDVLEELAARFGSIDPETLAAVSADRFPEGPIHLVWDR